MPVQITPGRIPTEMSCSLALSWAACDSPGRPDEMHVRLVKDDPSPVERPTPSGYQESSDELVRRSLSELKAGHPRCLHRLSS
ncbi:hypothetical protein AVEN_253208-1 [Araneus ventricosus]|uniref:Uncharacterized protein n=1 Tax=Araneus ventricosus TaxID=182803 RepID=A0A4Y2R123_ARAVE|nr:hypothetical protein AVEN_113188-1 [Araneus ventricosus]GBN69101.1 hypothetical protein AVEN_123715-1 [Araneus ventricosus]GBN70761.1 hypothetical protein AVEN_61806-1 [Araneus ventricosus]GBN70763.1 hypothetical protein AVEN_253208-1 [Araneus ventricosus]